MSEYTNAIHELETQMEIMSMQAQLDRLEAKLDSLLELANSKSETEEVAAPNVWSDADVGRVVFENGIKYQVVKNSLGTTYKKEMVRRQIPANAIPMPERPKMFEATTSLAEQQVKENEKEFIDSILSVVNNNTKEN